MKVLDGEPHAWFLLEEGTALYLDAFCTHSFLDYSVLIALSEAETKAYLAQGRSYISKLAYDIHDSAPAASGSRSPFKTRNLTIGDGGEAASAAIAIAEWQTRTIDTSKSD